MNFNTIINICTLITSVISLLTLIEMSKTRKSSLMPNIIFQTEYFIELNNPDSPYPISPFEWSVYESEEKKECNGLLFTNVGVNTAINIEYKWKFSIEEYINKIKEIEDSNEYKITFIENGNKMLFKSNHGFQILDNMNNKKNHIPYLEKSKTNSLHLPEDFKQIFSLFLFYQTCNFSKKTTNEIMNIIDQFKNYSFPTLKIIYYDISGKKYKKLYKTNFNVVLLSNEKIEFKFSIKEISSIFHH